MFSTPQTITLAGTQLELSDTTGTETITGPAAGVTVSGGGLSRVFQVDARCHRVDLGTDDHRRQRRRTLRRRPVQQCGTVTLTNCTVSGNYRLRRRRLCNIDGTLTLTNCTVSGNSPPATAAACIVTAARLTLTNCTVSGNYAGYAGGGLYGSWHGHADQLHRQRQHRHFGGGGLTVHGYGTITLTNTIVAGNRRRLRRQRHRRISSRAATT